MLEDTREIEAVSCDIAQYTWKIGKDGVTKIECYGENGHMALLAWFAIYVNGVLKVRMDSYAKSVSYKD